GYRRNFTPRTPYQKYRKDKPDRPRSPCFLCGHEGHWRDECPNRKWLLPDRSAREYQTTSKTNSKDSVYSKRKKSPTGSQETRLNERTEKAISILKRMLQERAPSLHTRMRWTKSAPELCPPQWQRRSLELVPIHVRD
ncbi:hypothetical protein V3C99_000527, partial [Haemonchus contortus]